LCSLLLEDTISVHPDIQAQVKKILQYYKNFIPVDGVVVAPTVGEHTCKVRAEGYGGRVRRRGGPNSNGSDARGWNRNLKLCEMDRRGGEKSYSWRGIEEAIGGWSLTMHTTNRRRSAGVLRQPNCSVKQGRKWDDKKGGSKTW
jgi:hypothetical protein